MSAYRRIETAKIVADVRYQRPVEEHRVQKIADNFDETLFGVLEVSRRNGKCAVFDGQHRLEAARLLGMKDVPCLVHDGLAPEQEAELFVRLQRERKNINPRDRFKARLFFGDPVAIDIDRIATEAGWEIKPNAADAKTDVWRIRAVSALERVYNQHGAQRLTETLRTLHGWWAGDKKATDGMLIEGMALFLRLYEGKLRDEHIEALRSTSPTVILRRATGAMTGGGSALAPIVADELKRTAGMRGPLPKLKKGKG